ncbi:SDR family NAD(P)-dependent oxidoreductase [Rhodococcus qingshengii]|uniref:SDR family NAD(P)-dependent oxidoreductase n=1 Tax=Rhodococcus qingshengii TaxID=334542 RepID=UPI001ADF2240|nr:SDR family oxidoreductase [Rhodococcus qingshengii]
MNLNDRVVIVTGGGRGLGAAYAVGAAKEGASVVIADIADASDTVRTIEEHGGTVRALKVDITDQHALESMVETVVGEFGRIDVLVNNAAYFRAAASGSFEDVALEELDKCLDVNIRGTWLCTKAVVPSMKAAGYGKIVNVSSASVWKGTSATGPHYLTSKAAIIGFTRALARELGPYNICVNSLIPDAIPEPADQAEEDMNSAAAQRQIGNRCLKRQQTPEDMVGTLVYLCGSGSDFVTGQSLHVNGGSYLT